MAQLKPGVLQILHEEGTTKPEKYFVAGGYALTHSNSTTVCLCERKIVGVQCCCLLSGGLIVVLCFFCYGVKLTLLLLWLPFHTQDVVCPETVKLDDLDSAAVSSNYDSAKKAYDAAAGGSVEQAEAQIAMEVNKAIGLALGVTLG